jgi:hypothetical protein
MVPIVFGVQQFCEGLVWTGLGQDRSALVGAASLFFLFFALAFWPFWIPFSAMLIEPRRRRKLALGFVTLLGLTGGLALYLPIVVNHALVSARIGHHSIQYNLDGLPAFGVLPQVLWHVLYLTVISVPPIVSSMRRFMGFGIAIVFASALSHVFFWYAFTSVWCLFAALLSLYLCYSFGKSPALKMKESGA